jgi:hypothetical protein
MKDNGDAEVCFPSQKSEIKDKFLEICRRDIKENFLNVK